MTDPLPPTPRRPGLRRRLAAWAAILTALAALLVVVLTAFDDPLILATAAAVVILAVATGYASLISRGAARAVAAIFAVLFLASVIVLLFEHAAVFNLALIVVAVTLASVAARAAMGVDPGALRTRTPPGTLTGPATHGVLFMNPRSGGGKVEAFHLVAECEARGIEAVVLGPGDDLEALARAAVAAGADVLGMAGGDGSQALVAGVAAEADLPFVCVPAGTRNHLALDIGLDRADVVGALDAYTEASERRIDLGFVAGRVFVNNVSLGVYARIVQSDGYRDQKLGTAAAMLPELLGEGEDSFGLTLDAPDGHDTGRPALVLVSNNVYELTRLGGFGSRHRLDAGVLGVVAVEVHGPRDVARLVALESAGRVQRFGGWHEWSAPTLEVGSAGRLEAGVDGEALVFDAPVRFQIRPQALRVRVPLHAPGLSPAAIAARGGLRRFGSLFRVAFGLPVDH